MEGRSMNLLNCWTLGLLVLGFCLLSPPLNTHADDEKDKRNSAPPATIQVINAKTSAYTLASGTTFVSSLETLLTTQYNQPNDAFSLRLIHDVWVNNQKILPKGTRIEGYVEESIAPIQGRDAILKLKAHTLHTLDDHTLPLQATLFTSRDDAGLTGGKVTQPMNGRLVRYEIMGLGMINRVMPEGPRAMGEHQRLNPGQLIRIRLDAPLTVIHSPYDETL
jgi:hypothetical protein